MKRRPTRIVLRKFEMQILSLQSFFGALTASSKSLIYYNIILYRAATTFCAVTTSLLRRSSDFSCCFRQNKKIRLFFARIFVICKCAQVSFPYHLSLTHQTSSGKQCCGTYIQPQTTPVKLFSLWLPRMLSILSVHQEISRAATFLA